VMSCWLEKHLHQPETNNSTSQSHTLHMHQNYEKRVQHYNMNRNGRLASWREQIGVRQHIRKAEGSPASLLDGQATKFKISNKPISREQMHNNNKYSCPTS
jgi:hypothetical protein